MEIAFHLGAHCTDENQLLRSLLDDKGRLADQGICVPGPGRYRDVIVNSPLTKSALDASGLV